MRKKDGNQVFGVIGTGRFGLAVAEELLSRGKYVIALDQDQQRLKPLYETDAEVFVVNDISKESLMDAGLQEADTVIVGIGKDVESSILAALNALELGVKHVICKVISEDHAKILKKLGADVVFPETEIGRRTAIRLSERLRDGKANGRVGPDTVLHVDEILVLSGSNKDLDKFQHSFND